MPPTNSTAALARAQDLHVRALDDELLIYDERSDEAHCLTAVAARVWQACDGERSVARIARDLGLDEEVVAEVLLELGDKALLVRGAGPAGELSRRRLIGRAAAVAATPFVISAVVPPAQAAASSHCFQINCTTDAVCATAGCGTCNVGTGKCRNP